MLPVIVSVRTIAGEHTAGVNKITDTSNRSRTATEGLASSPCDYGCQVTEPLQRRTLGLQL